MFRKPPTRLESLQESVSETFDTLQHKIEPSLEKLRDVREHAAEVAGSGLETAAQRASVALHVAGDTVGGAVKTVPHVASHGVELLGEKAHDIAGSAAQTFGVVAHRASSNAAGISSAAHDRAVAARESAADLRVQAAKKAARLAKSVHSRRDEAAETAHEIAEAAHHKAEIAREKAAQALASTREGAQTRAAGLGAFFTRAHDETLDESKEAAHAAAQLVAASEKQGRKAAKLVRKQAAEVAAVQASLAKGASRRNKAKGAELAEVRIEEKSSVLLWLLAGLALGAVVALLLAPTSGRRARAKLRDTAGKAKRGLTETAGQTLENVKTSAAGAYTGTVGDLESDLETTNDAIDDGDDATIADRVRTALGENELTRGHERLNVDSCQGVVTLRGPLPDENRSALETFVRTIKGVRDVKLETLSESDEETFVG